MTTMDHMHRNASLLAQSIPIAHLPLRRSTAALLRACGFNTAKEVYDCCIAPPRYGGNDGIDGGDRCSNSACIMNLALEFRHYRNQNQNACSSGNIESNSPMNDVTSVMDEEMMFSQNVFLELIDAVSIVTQDDTIGFHTSTNGRNNQIGIDFSHSLSTTSTGKTAADLLRLHQDIIGYRGTKFTNILTFCRALDSLLGGGIAIGELTELAGSPGSGKTTMCMQLAVNASLPHYCCGVHGRTVYIDTEGSFAPERCYDLATHLIQHVQTSLLRQYRESLSNGNGTANRSNGKTFNNKDSGEQQYEWNVTAEDILNNILVYRAHDIADVSAIVHGALPALLASSSTGKNNSKSDLPIRLVIIDSIAFPYRAVASPSNMRDSLSTTQLSSASATTMDYATRTQHLNATAAALTSMSVQHQLAIVAVNQMTTKFTKDDVMINENDPNHVNSNVCRDSSTTPRTKLIPALGESWAHAVTSRLILNKSMSYSNSNDTEEHQQYRICSLTKSPRLPSGEAHLLITNAGIRGSEHIDALKAKRARTENTSL